MIIDYSENHANLQQGEIQSTYFVHDTFFISIASGYLQVNGKVINKDVTIMSEGSDHSRTAAFPCINKVLDFTREKQLDVTNYFITGETNVPANFGLFRFFAFFRNGPISEMILVL